MAETILESPRFPEDISYGSSGGPSYNTDVITVNSGHETRNVNWAQARYAYNVAFGIRTQEYLNGLVEFFHAVRGKAYGFRYKDWSDYTSSNTADITDTDQQIGIGSSSDGYDGTSNFQVIKNYSAGYLQVRDITKIVPGTLIVSVANIPQILNTHYTVDNNTGMVSFISGQVPLEDQIIKVGYEFDVPVRFDTDELNINLEMYEHGTTDVPLLELRI